MFQLLCGLGRGGKPAAPVTLTAVELPTLIFRRRKISLDHPLNRLIRVRPGQFRLNQDITYNKKRRIPGNKSKNTKRNFQKAAT